MQNTHIAGCTGPGCRVAPKFTLDELAALQYWCLRYRDLVQSGRTPAAEQDARFIRFSTITYAVGVAHVEP